MKKKLRIDVTGSQEELQAPFAGLDLPGLPAGPADPVASADLAKRIPTGKLQFRKEKSHRGGKSVVVVFGFDPGFSQSAIEELAREVRIQCGCGGTVREREIEFQGEDPDRFMRIFRDLL
ncbi:MAG: translation initiation factor [Verrucomicrobiae bacterium]